MTADELELAKKQVIELSEQYGRQQGIVDQIVEDIKTTRRNRDQVVAQYTAILGRKEAKRDAEAQTLEEIGQRRAEALQILDNLINNARQSAAQNT